MKIKITLTGAHASGKSHLARKLKEFLEQECFRGTGVVIDTKQSARAFPRREMTFTTGENIQRFSDGKPKPYLSRADYDQLRDDNKFLYNRGDN